MVGPIFFIAVFFLYAKHYARFNSVRYILAQLATHELIITWMAERVRVCLSVNRGVEIRNR